MRFGPKVRHMVLAVLCLVYFVAYIDRVNISVAGPLIRSELGLTPTELGLIFSAFAYPYAAMQIVGGWLSDKFGPRLVLTVLSVLWAVATIMTGLSWSIASLVAFRVLVGLGEGGAFPTATRALTFWMPVGERGFAQGITHSFARLGGAVTPPIVLAIVARSGWRDSFIVLGLLSALCTVAWVVVFRNTPSEHPWITTSELDEMNLAGVIGDTLGGVASDTLFRRTGNLRLARRALLLVGLLGALAFIIPAVMTSSPRAAVYGLALAFFFLELTNAVLWTLPIDIAGTYAGTAGGMMNTGFGVAGMISPVVFGVIIERTGRYDLPFLLSAGLLLVGAVCSMFIDPTRKIQDRVEWSDAVKEGTYAC